MLRFDSCKRSTVPVSLLQIFPNADLRLLKQCVSLRDELLQMQYEQHKVGSYMTTILFYYPESIFSRLK